MPQTIELEVGPLYAQLHERFKDQLGDQYEQQSRQEFESFLHELNQTLERQVEAAAAEQGELDLEEVPDAE